MSNRRKTKDQLELKLLEVTEDPTYRKEQKQTSRTPDVAAEAEVILVAPSTKKPRTLH